MLMIEIIIAFFLTIAMIVGLAMAFGWRNLHYRLLSHDIKKWQKEGWVSAENAVAILDDKRPKGLAGRLVFLVGLLGALLLLFAAISFVAANWDDMSRLSRLTWLIVSLWSTFLIGWRLTANGRPKLAEIAYLLGVGLFGVNITLIAQMFHIDSHPPNGVLMWTIGALVAAVLLQSRAALVATFLGALTWSMMEVISYDVLIHWPFLLVWGAAFALSLRMRWSFIPHLAFLTLLIWTITALLRYAADGHWSPHGILAMFIIAFLLLLANAFVWQARNSHSSPYGFANWLERYAILGLMPALFALQTIPLKFSSTIYGSRASDVEPSLSLLQGNFGWLPLTILLLIGTVFLFGMAGREKILRPVDLVVFAAIAGSTLLFALISMPNIMGIDGWQISRATHKFLATWIYGAAFLSLLIWLISFGHRRGSDLYVWVALATFAVEVLYIYFSIFGSLLETSLFFLVGGILTMGLAFFLYRLHQRLEAPSMPQNEVSS